MEIRKALQADADTVIADLHIWQVAVNKFAAIISVVAHEPKTPAAYKQLLREHEELVHVTIEVNLCPGDRQPYGLWRELLNLCDLGPFRILRKRFGF